MAAGAQKTVVQTHDPDNGDRYIRVLELDGVSLPVDPQTQLTIDGETWAVIRRSVSVSTLSPACVVTVITAVKYGGGNA